MVSGLVCCYSWGWGVGRVQTVTSSLVLACSNTIVIDVSIEPMSNGLQLNFNLNWPFLSFEDEHLFVHSLVPHIYTVFTFSKKKEKMKCDHSISSAYTFLCSLAFYNTLLWLQHDAFRGSHNEWKHDHPHGHETFFFSLFVSISVTSDVGLHCGRWGNPGRIK